MKAFLPAVNIYSADISFPIVSHRYKVRMYTHLLPFVEIYKKPELLNEISLLPAALHLACQGFSCGFSSVFEILNFKDYFLHGGMYN